MKALPFPCIRPAQDRVLEALPQIIDGLIADGYKIVTLSDLVKTDTSLRKKTHLADEGHHAQGCRVPPTCRGQRHRRVVIG